MHVLITSWGRHANVCYKPDCENLEVNKKIKDCCTAWMIVLLVLVGIGAIVAAASLTD